MADLEPPRRAFVTGASGFIGAALVRRLRELGSEVIGVDRAAGGDPAVVRADVTMPGEWQGRAAGCDLVVPTAAVVGMCRGRGLLSPVYADDLVEGVMLAATAPAAAGGIFTLTGESSVTCAEFFGQLSAMLGVPAARTVPTGLARVGARVVDGLARLRRAPNELTPGVVDYLSRRGSYSIAKARAVLGYAPAVDLLEGMRRTGTWLRAAGLIPGPDAKPR